MLPLAGHQIDLLLKIFVPFDCYGLCALLTPEQPSSSTACCDSSRRSREGEEREGEVNTVNKCCVKFISLHWHFMMTWRVLFHFAVLFIHFKRRSI